MREKNETVPGRQGQRPEYQEEGSGDRRLSGWRGEGAFSAQGTRVLKHPRLCLSLRTPSRSHGLFAGGEGRQTHITTGEKSGSETRGKSEYDKEKEEMRGDKHS